MQRIARAYDIPAVSCPGRVCVALVTDGGDWWTARSRGGSWSLRRMHIPDASPYGATFEDMSCSSARACVAVGSTEVGSEGADEAIVAHWNGRRWRFPYFSTPRYSGLSYMDGVSCVSARDCLAVGDVVEHWNGRKWSLQGSDRAGSDFYTGASCVNSVCEAIGYVADVEWPTTVVAERKRDARWSRQRLPVPRGAPSGSLFGVSCPSVDMCLAVGLVQGKAAAERWDGRAWTLLPIPHSGSGETLNAVSCASPTSCTAVGVGNAAIIEQWDGHRWRRSRLQLGDLLGVSCSSRKACMAVGDKRLAGGRRVPVAARWNGTSWTRPAVPIPSAPPSESDVVKLESVSCESATACIAVGLANDKTLTEAWDGARWRIQPSTDPTADVSVLRAVSCTSTNACTAVGFSCTAVAVTARCGYEFSDRAIDLGTRTLAKVWNGNRWTIQPTPDPPNAGAALAGVSCAAADCVAVGSIYAPRFYPDTNALGVGATEPWVQVAGAPQPVDGSRTSYEELSSVSCQAATCTAVGERVTPDHNSVPLIAQGPT